MKPRILVLIFMLAPCATRTAQAQRTPTFTRPAVTLRTGAVQTVNVESDKLAPYAEVQAQVNLSDTPFGLALHGGLSYERYRGTASIICGVIPPCWQGEIEGRETFTDFVTGLRFGLFPRRLPVDAFAGFATHLVRHSTDGDARWPLNSTIEVGADAQLPLTRRFGVGAGVRWFWPVQVGEQEQQSRPPSAEDMSRYGLHLSVQYRL